MNPQNQKPENTNPDLDFIRNTTDPLEAPVKKGLDKKIIVIIVLVVITIGVLVFGMVTGANNKVQKSSDNAKISISSDESVSKAKDVISAFFENVANGNAEEAWRLFSSNPGFEAEPFKNKTIPFLQKLDISNCIAAPNQKDRGLVDENGRLLQLYVCKAKSSKVDIGLEFRLDSNDEGVITIHDYGLVAIE